VRDELEVADSDFEELGDTLSVIILDAVVDADSDVD